MYVCLTSTTLFDILSVLKNGLFDEASIHSWVHTLIWRTTHLLGYVISTIVVRLISSATRSRGRHTWSAVLREDHTPLLLLVFSFIDLGSQGLISINHIYLQCERNIVNLAYLLGLNHNWRLLHVHYVHRVDCLGFVWYPLDVVWRHYGDCLDHSNVVIGVVYHSLTIFFRQFQPSCRLFGLVFSASTHFIYHLSSGCMFLMRLLIYRRWCITISVRWVCRYFFTWY